MVYPSNPRLMNRVLDAVVHLCDGKGSTARDVLDYLRQTSKSTPRNLTMQVHRALKHAVNAGLLRHRSGRYKAVFTLNPAPIKQSVNESNEQKSIIEMNMQQRPSSVKMIKEDNNNRRKRRKSRQERKRKNNNQRKRKHHSRSKKIDELKKNISEIRKLKYKENESGRSPRNKISTSKMRENIGNPSGSSARKKSDLRPRDSNNYSDLSDSSDYEDKKVKVTRKNMPTMCDEYKYEGNVKQNRRSISRNRSPQRQKSQQLHKYFNDINKTNKPNIADIEKNEEAQEEEKNEPNNSGSGSTL
ncbi:arginine/serine-rich coiled-coil protein 2-like [Apis cerana]|uniref:H15 domain-containing protein n=1 Tax=Apis cerana cerana TaxID=94128 RepID=A0A2A3EJ57_APICC|nr:arginine/serine-rich coiled-coil protein 2-like [Apis cerana]PBC31757.1 hypothetical protein APICC_09544 [Apis cerana cerana]